MDRVGLFGIALAAALALGCKTEPPATAKPTAEASATSTSASGGAPAIGGARPVRFVHAPKGARAPMPLVLVLHGYGGDGRDGDGYFELGAMAEREGLVVLAPDGTRDATGHRFWNAVDGCCDFEKRGVDDVAYLTGLVDEAAKAFPVDPKRVYAVGLSNGGAMAMRLACDASERFAAVVSVAGPFYTEADRCRPREPVAVRHVHGTSDSVVPYAGGPPPPGLHPSARAARFPHAEEITRGFASRNGCAAPPVTDAPIDFDAAVPGEETIVTRYGQCRGGADVEHWKLRGSDHVPSPKRFGATTLAFLRAHAKP